MAPPPECHLSSKPQVYPELLLLSLSLNAPRPWSSLYVLRKRNSHPPSSSPLLHGPSCRPSVLAPHLPYLHIHKVDFHSRSQFGAIHLTRLVFSPVIPFRRCSHVVMSQSYVLLLTSCRFPACDAPQLARSLLPRRTRCSQLCAH